MKNNRRIFSSSLYSFKLNLIPQKSLRVAFANKISFSSYSSNSDPQNLKTNVSAFILTPILSKLSWKVDKMRLQIMLQKDVLLQKWFDSQNSNCNTMTAFCNKLSVSQYSVFLDRSSLRFE